MKILLKKILSFLFVISLAWLAGFIIACMVWPYASSQGQAWGGLGIAVLFGLFCLGGIE